MSIENIRLNQKTKSDNAEQGVDLPRLHRIPTWSQDETRDKQTVESNLRKLGMTDAQIEEYFAMQIEAIGKGSAIPTEFGMKFAEVREVFRNRVSNMTEEELDVLSEDLAKTNKNVETNLKTLLEQERQQVIDQALSDFESRGKGRQMGNLGSPLALMFTSFGLSGLWDNDPIRISMSMLSAAILLFSEDISRLINSLSQDHTNNAKRRYRLEEINRHMNFLRASIQMALDEETKNNLHST